MSLKGYSTAYVKLKLISLKKSLLSESVFDAFQGPPVAIEKLLICFVKGFVLWQLNKYFTGFVKWYVAGGKSLTSRSGDLVWLVQGGSP